MTLPDQIPALILSDSPGNAACIAGPIPDGDRQMYIVKVINDDKVLACALTRDQITELWCFVRMNGYKP